MAKPFRPSATSLSVKIKGDNITITFNAQNWNPIHGMLLDSLALNAEYAGIPVADHIAHAIELKMQDISTSPESMGRLIRLYEQFVADQDISPTSTRSIDHNTLRYK